MKICINPGHGPKDSGVYDPGAVGTKVKEAWQNIEVARMAKPILEKAGHNVLIVQDGDLADVVRASNSFKADYFISIHCNSSTNPSAHGTETYALAPGGKGEKLARAIQAELVKATGLADRGVKFANYYVLKYTDAPAVLVEMAFISNPQEERLMMNDQGDMMFAKAIAQGILKGIK